MARFVIRGTRGTMPACGVSHARYGGNTTCFSLETTKGIIVVDAGTGIAHLARELMPRSRIPPITILFTHFHLDHIMGLPFFHPLYNRRCAITIMAHPGQNPKWRRTLATFMANPYWPVGIGDLSRMPRLHDLPPGRTSMALHGIRVSWLPVPHPQANLAYRFDSRSTSIVVATDAEYTPGTLTPQIVGFCRNCDYLIFDAQYTPAEYPSYKGWGHSTWAAAVKLAEMCGARRLVLTHHAPERPDAAISAIVRTARKMRQETTAYAENTSLPMD